MYGHCVRRPSFDYRHGLSQELRDLFPALQRFGLLLTLGLLAALLEFPHSGLNLIGINDTSTTVPITRTSVCFWRGLENRYSRRSVAGECGVLPITRD